MNESDDNTNGHIVQLYESNSDINRTILAAVGVTAVSCRSTGRHVLRGCVHGVRTLQT